MKKILSTIILSTIAATTIGLSVNAIGAHNHNESDTSSIKVPTKSDMDALHIDTYNYNVSNIVSNNISHAFYFIDTEKISNVNYPNSTVFKVFEFSQKTPKWTEIMITSDTMHLDNGSKTSWSNSHFFADYGFFNISHISFMHGNDGYGWDHSDSGHLLAYINANDSVDAVVVNSVLDFALPADNSSGHFNGQVRCVFGNYNSEGNHPFGPASSIQTVLSIPLDINTNVNPTYNSAGNFYTVGTAGYGNKREWVKLWSFSSFHWISHTINYLHLDSQYVNSVVHKNTGSDTNFLYYQNGDKVNAMDLDTGHILNTYTGKLVFHSQSNNIEIIGNNITTNYSDPSLIFVRVNANGLNKTNYNYTDGYGDLISGSTKQSTITPLYNLNKSTFLNKPYTVNNVDLAGANALFLDNGTFISLGGNSNSFNSGRYNPSINFSAATGDNAIANATTLATGNGIYKTGAIVTPDTDGQYDLYGNGGLDITISNSPNIKQVADITGGTVKPNDNGYTKDYIIYYDNAFSNRTYIITYQDGSTSTVNVDVTNKINDHLKADSKDAVNGLISDSSGNALDVYANWNNDLNVYIKNPNDEIRFNLHAISNGTTPALNPFNLLFTTNDDSSLVGTYLMQGNFNSKTNAATLKAAENQSTSTTFSAQTAKNGTNPIVLRQYIVKDKVENDYTLLITNRLGQQEFINIQSGGQINNGTTFNKSTPANTPVNPGGLGSHGSKTTLIIGTVVGIPTAAIGFVVFIAIMRKRARTNTFKKAQR